jgi:type VI secretion system secreted protein VgrG
MNIDIATTVKVLIGLLGLGLLVSVYFGYQSIKVGLHLQFFRKRRDIIAHGWTLIFLAIGFGVFALIISRFGEPVAYRYFPPSPTVTSTPTITLTPTITMTPKDTLTPTITPTLQYTYTPGLPLQAQQTIQTPVGPDTRAIFSSVQFASKLGKDGVVTDDVTSFPATVAHIYGGYSFDGMVLGVQWTAIWLLDNTPVYIETNAWKVGSGGYGYTDWDCSTGACVPGNYEVQIFVGSTWKNSGRFTITGAATTGTATTGTITPSPASTIPGVFDTLTPTLTPAPISG